MVVSSTDVSVLKQRPGKMVEITKLAVPVLRQIVDSQLKSRGKVPTSILFYRMFFLPPLPPSHRFPSPSPSHTSGTEQRTARADPALTGVRAAVAPYGDGAGALLPRAV